jgi:catechol 2,3-dioxygenase-like lactoylglutathione lyase family enzyme
MIDHFTLTVSDLEKSKAFYSHALKPLGYSMAKDYGEICGFGPAGRPYFWLKQGQPTQPMHIAFQAKARPMVEAFHQAALAAGARDDGAPGIRETYHPNYYGAFAIDPDGHPIEAVCHLPEGMETAAKPQPAKKIKAAPRATVGRRGTQKKAGRKPAKKQAKRRRG